MRQARSSLVSRSTALLIAGFLVLGATQTIEEPDTIVVTGERARHAEAAADLASAITLRPRIDTPLARHYTPICIKMFGIAPAYGEVIADRIEQNAATLGLAVGKTGCQTNVWIGFARNSREELVQLRKKNLALFAQLKSFEVDRVFEGSGAAQLLHVTEVRSSDGRPIPTVSINVPGLPPIEAKFNQQYQSGRLISPIRSDINGTLLIFDKARADGRTIRQLADYATIRILAPVQDVSAIKPGAPVTVLHLFAEGADPPDGLTDFDWSYLAAYYKLDRGAKAASVHDAVRRSVAEGTGQKLQEASASKQN